MEFKKSLPYIKGAAGISLAVLIGVQSQVSGYIKGYTHGLEDKESAWKTRLIAADYAEFDRKTGVWKLKSMEEVLLVGTMLGKSPMLGFFPEPEVDVHEIKERLKVKARK